MTAPVESLLVLRMVEERFHRDSEDDRPIREGRTPPELLREGEIEYRTCPHAGSRLGKPMNAPALKQTGARWDEISDALAFLRAAYTRARGGNYGPDLLDLWRVSQLGSSLPWFYILRAPDGRSPAYAAALSKATLGTGILTQRMFVEMLATQELPKLTPEALLERAEATETMLAETEVCAASEKMILKFFEVLVEPGRRYKSVGQVAGIVAERAAVLGFGAHYLAFKHLVWMHYLARRFLYADLLAGLGEHALADGALARLDEPCEPPDFFVVAPGDMDAVPLEMRKTWFRTLAVPLIPFALDGSDAGQCTRATEFSLVMSEDPDVTEVAAEVERVTGIGGPAAGRIGRAIAQYVRLDALHGDAIAAAETGFRRAFGHAQLADATATVDAAVRDRLQASSPRAYFASLAPDWFAAHARP